MEEGSAPRFLPTSPDHGSIWNAERRAPARWALGTAEHIPAPTAPHLAAPTSAPRRGRRRNRVRGSGNGRGGGPGAGHAPGPGGQPRRTARRPGPGSSGRSRCQDARKRFPPLLPPNQGAPARAFSPECRKGCTSLLSLSLCTSSGRGVGGPRGWRVRAAGPRATPRRGLRQPSERLRPGLRCALHSLLLVKLFFLVFFPFLSSLSLFSPCVSYSPFCEWAAVSLFRGETPVSLTFLNQRSIL